MGNALDWMTYGAACFIFVPGDKDARPAKIGEAPWKCTSKSYRGQMVVQVSYQHGVGRRAQSLWVHRPASECYRTLGDALLAQADREEAEADKHREEARLLRLRAACLADDLRRVNQMEAGGAFHAADER